MKIAISIKSLEVSARLITLTHANAMPAAVIAPFFGDGAAHAHTCREEAAPLGLIRRGMCGRLFHRRAEKEWRDAAATDGRAIIAGEAARVTHPKLIDAGAVPSSRFICFRVLEIVALIRRKITPKRATREPLRPAPAGARIWRSQSSHSF